MGIKKSDKMLLTNFLPDHCCGGRTDDKPTTAG